MEITQLMVLRGAFVAARWLRRDDPSDEDLTEMVAEILHAALHDQAEDR